MRQFTVSRLPELLFGEGRLFELPAVLRRMGVSAVALVTGGRSFRDSENRERLLAALREAGIRAAEFSVRGEPSPEEVDGIAAELKGSPGPRVDGVAAVGGGSAIDAAKAVSALLTMEGSVADYLEGVGSRVPPGTRLPLVAAPTTAGTGTEATKNAVISRVGEGGFKKSLRHDNFIPDAAILDPLLTLSCPPEVTAASGLDAVTQLLEAFTSPRGSPFTDAMALDALRIAGDAFPRVCRDGGDREARAGMAYAAYVSGVCLAHAGLGVVHGIASPLGGMFHIPHGLICGTLVAEASRFTIGRAMRIDDPSGGSVLKKYARAGRALSGREAGSDFGDAALLINTLEALVERARLPRLGALGLTEEDARRVADKTAAPNHPVPLSPDDVFDILRRRI